MKENKQITSFRDEYFFLSNFYPCDLIEENTWGDTFWGACKGKGKNVLGKLLMKVRERFARVCPQDLYWRSLMVLMR